MDRIIVIGILAFLALVQASTQGILPVRNEPISSDIKIQKIISKRQARQFTYEAYPTNKCPSGVNFINVFRAHFLYESYVLVAFF